MNGINTGPVSTSALYKPVTHLYFKTCKPLFAVSSQIGLPLTSCPDCLLFVSDSIHIARLDCIGHQRFVYISTEPWNEERPTHFKRRNVALSLRHQHRYSNERSGSRYHQEICPVRFLTPIARLRSQKRRRRTPLNLRVTPKIFL